MRSTPAASTAVSTTESPTLRVPLFARLLGSVVGLIVVTVVVLVVLSVREFRRDKEIYVLDFTGQVAEGLALQIDGFLDSERQKMMLLGVVLGDDTKSVAVRTKSTEEMLASFPELVHYEVVPPGATPIRLYNRTRLAALGYASSDAWASARRPHDPAEVKTGALVVTPQFFSDDDVGLTIAYRDAHKGLMVADIHAPSVTRPFLEVGAAEIFLVDGEGRTLLHPQLRRGAQAPDATRSELVKQATTATLPAARPFRAPDGTEFLGAFAPVPVAKLAVVSQVPATRAYAAARRLVTTALVASVALLVLMSVLAALTARRFTGPLVRMARATEKIATGDFRVFVPVKRGDEIGDLARSLNSMSSELLRRDRRLHEAQEALVASEKMAAFGQLSAGIAHEVKNPLAGILGFCELATRKVKPEDPISRYLSMIEKETRRCNDIIQNLLKFARREKMEMAPIDINAVVADTFKLVNHQLGLKSIHVDVELFPKLPRVNGNANQLQQVLLNLGINAGDAMPNGGSLKMTTQPVMGPDGRVDVEIRVTDSGTGIPPEVKAKIFDPFFTTKEPGKGTGLGLSVSYGIVRDHGASINVESEVGNGTTFVLVFPGLEEDEAQAAHAGGAA